MLTCDTRPYKWDIQWEGNSLVEVCKSILLAITSHKLPNTFLGKWRIHTFIHLSIGFWLYTALQCRNSMSSNYLDFHTSGGILSNPAAFLFLIFLSTKSSSSCVDGPSLMSNCLLIILVTGSCLTFVKFPSKFSKYCILRCIRSFFFVKPLLYTICVLNAKTILL